MDIINGGIVQGSIPGTAVSGAKLTKGMLGNGVLIDSHREYVEYITHDDDCYHKLSLCTDGATFAFWLNVHGKGPIVAIGNRTVGLIVTSSINPFSLNIFVTHNSIRYSYIVDWPFDQWKQIVFTWSLEDKITLYSDGCNVDPARSHGSATSVAPPRPTPDRMIIGSYLHTKFISGRLTLDEFHIWNEKLSPEHIWQFYIQGGKI